MIWLASYPRSGNTFFRIVLHEVYGIESRAFHLGRLSQMDAQYRDFPVVKTHLLPHQLIPDDPKIPVIYLVRDGRDAVISMAHQRADLIAPGSDYHENLRDVILAPAGTHFGGWSRHIRLWHEHASLVIRFEELIEKPIECIERIRPFLNLPEPRMDKLPTFQDLRTKEFPYSGTRHADLREERRKKFFRRGKVGAWQDEMPEELFKLFMEFHGDVLKELGYYEDSDHGSEANRPAPGAPGEPGSKREAANLPGGSSGVHGEALPKFLSGALDLVRGYASECKRNTLGMSYRLAEIWNQGLSRRRPIIDSAKEQEVIPDFIVIGATECGAIRFFRYLGQHPGIRQWVDEENDSGAGAGILEHLHFFDHHFNKGMKWYRTQFPGGAGLTGEATPYYIRHPEVPQRIRLINPGAKIIMLCRDPVERAFLQYRNMLASGRLDPGLSFGEKAAVDIREVETLNLDQLHAKLRQNIVYGGLYAHFHRIWQRHFPPDQMLAIQSERFFSHPLETLNQAFHFLGLDPFASSVPAPAEIKDLQEMDPEGRSMLQEFFRPHNLALQECTDISWSYP